MAITLRISYDLNGHIDPHPIIIPSHHRVAQGFDPRVARPAPREDLGISNQRKHGIFSSFGFGPENVGLIFPMK